MTTDRALSTSGHRGWLRRGTGLATAAVLAATGLVAAPALANPSAYNVVDRTATSGVTADALPTTQIDGVAWTQKIVGNTVFVGGQFANARPAGAAPGTNLTPRANLLAYDLTTGELRQDFQADTNGTVNTMAVSPDGSTLYIGGTFTSVQGQARYRLAAIDIASGKVTAWQPGLDAAVYSIAVSNDAVYIGGGFSSANGQARQKLAAFSRTTGSLLGWAPTANGIVRAMAITPDQSKVIVGGSFAYLNNSYQPGSGAIDAGNGAVLPWAFNRTVRNSGTNAGIYSMSSDGKNIIITGFSWTVGMFEGAALVNPDDGAIKWMADCHGDSYSATAAMGLVFVASHEHNCENMSSFPQTNNPTQYRYATAFTYDATSTVLPNRQFGYTNYAGLKAPAHVDWFPNLAMGTYTGQSQAAWTTDANSQYVVYGGEFPRVNGRGQQGLVRFAVPGIAPGTVGPKYAGAEMQAKATVNGTIATLTWPANVDDDNMALEYQVYRDDNLDRPIGTVKGDSLWWDRPTMSFTDPTMEAGRTYTYHVTAVDPDGNRARGGDVTVTAGQPTASTRYLQVVLPDQPSHMWRQDETVPNTMADSVGNLPMKHGIGVGRNRTGVLAGSPASWFDGMIGGWSYTGSTEYVGNDYSSEVWLNTRTGAGGTIISQGSQPEWSSPDYDRQVYMLNDGRIAYSVKSNGVRKAITSTQRYNNGAWHHVVSSLGERGMELYVDGVLVASDASTTSASDLAGYWRLGGENLAVVPNRPASNWINATLDEAAIYPHALTAEQVRAHAQAGGIQVP